MNNGDFVTVEIEDTIYHGQAVMRLIHPWPSTVEAMFIRIERFGVWVPYSLSELIGFGAKITPASEKE